ncbi:Helix-turn-helix domain-containing protein [Roseomonas rosea]|uniref:Helix-turn-helix domain-containing protein n=1 Tax=Muricoccus roseus TaxID=198092 RepID=A0A1M6IZP8_9PROT|nr:AraC family transcriptional regulator [Roseomonas rosea]SHJ39887.1 Helix-turn-helix domain-containing protein [Roseomonas rosea]
MLDPDFLLERQAGWGMAPAAALRSIPSTGASVLRWRSPAAGPFEMQPLLSEHTIVSLNLRPMRAEAWLGKRRVWAGPIASHAVRIVPPGVERRWATTDAFDLLHIMLPPRAFQAVAGPGCGPFVLSDPLYGSDALVGQVGLQLVSAMEEGGPYLTELADGLCRALVAHLLRHYHTPAPSGPRALPPARLRRVKALVRDRLGEDLTVGRMAAEAGYSEFHFARLFRAATGQTPHRFLLEARIARARRLLAKEGQTILAVALECGFKNASHFSRVFRAQVGATPHAYRDGLV